MSKGAPTVAVRQSNVNKIYRFMRRKGQLLQILSTHSAQHKIYRFIWRKWRFFFSSCKIWIFHGYILAFKLAFLQKFLNQKVQFSTNIMTKQKNLFAKMVRILQIHLISLSCNSTFSLPPFKEAQILHKFIFDYSASLPRFI